MKRCSCCKVEKDESDFSKDCQNRDGLRSCCRACGKMQWQEYIKKNPAKQHEANARYYQKNKDKMVTRSREYKKRPGVKEKIKEWTREYYRRPEVKAMPSLKEYRRKYYKQEHVRKKQYDYSKLPHVKQRTNERERQRKIVDPFHKLMCVMRSHLAGSIRTPKGKHKWEAFVGYGQAELIEHLEKHFTAGMTWDNYGRKGWHIDHIIPISAFNFTCVNDYDFKRCWALSNLRPMWAFDNISKGAKLDNPFQQCLL